MKKILFRGKRTDSSEWVEGFLWCEWYAMRQRNDYHIYTFNKTDDGEIFLTGNYIVDPETVGQYTGLKDSTGKMIFEGDILEFWQPEFDLADKSWGIVRYFADEGYPAFDIETLNVDSNGLSYIMANCECEIKGETE